MFAGHRVGREGPDQEPAHRRRGHARAGARRGVRRGDGVEHQLQHGVDVDLRAAADVRVPRPLRPRERRGPPATPCRTTSSAPTPPASCCASARRCATGSPATGSRCTATHVDDQDPSAHDDSMLAANQRIWGFETNFGGLADLAVVKANQLMPKPTHLTWEEAAVNALCNSTQLPHARRPQRRPDEAGRHRARSGARPAASAATPCSTCSTAAARRSASCRRRRRPSCCNELGVEAVIDRKAEGYRFWSDEHTQDESEWRRFGKKIRELVGDDPDIVFEHPGRQTMGASIFAVQARRHRRHVRGDVGLHGRVRQPPLLDEAEAADRQPLRQLRRGVGGQPADRPGPDPADAVGGVPARPRSARPPARSTATSTRARSACCASRPTEGLGIDDPEKRARIGEDKITCSAGTAADAGDRGVWIGRSRRCQDERDAADRDRPRRHRRQRPRGGDRVLRAGVRRDGRPTARSSSATASRRRC